MMPFHLSITPQVACQEGSYAVEYEQFLTMRGDTMQSALRTTAWVQPGGKIEVEDTQLPVGQPVEVIVLLPQPQAAPRRSILDVLAEAPGHLAFQTAEEVDAYLHEERDAWER